MPNVLIVCTANRCRSPIAAALLRQQLPQRSAYAVDSAGLLPGGFPAEAQAQQRLCRFGVDLSGHRSATLTPRLLARSDLILAMTRRHVLALIEQDAACRPYTFTIKDFVRRGEAVRELPDAPDDLAGLVRRLARDRPVEELLGRSTRDNIADPMGRSQSVWNDVVGQLADQVDRLAAVLTGLAG